MLRFARKSGNEASWIGSIKTLRKSRYSWLELRHKPQWVAEAEKTFKTMQVFSSALAVLGSLALVGCVRSTEKVAHPTWHTLYIQPEQLHLSLGSSPDKMVATWTTLDSTHSTFCKYGVEHMDQVVNGTQSKFVDGGKMKRELFIHRATMTDLKPNTTYKYHCGAAGGVSNMFTFKTLPQGTDWMPRFVVYADLGNINGRSIERVSEQVQNGEYDVLLHVGDMAYDLHHDNALVGDEFMRQIEPIAGYLPYQVCPGNHEHMYNFSNYDARFSMHSQGDEHISNHFWSYNIGPVHVIGLSTEFHYYQQYGSEQIMNQYRWLEADLKEANKPENRAKHPWIITMGHRPLYCQFYENELLRVGEHGHPGFEKLLHDYGVDLHLAGHEHNYERLWPVYGDKVMNGSLEHPYTNPKATVHVITGSAGCRENHTRIIKKREHFSAFIVEDYGYSRMTVMNRTHLRIEQISEDKNGAVIDDFYLIKEKHGPEAWQ